MVSVLAFYFNDQSSIPAGYLIFSVQKDENKQKKWPGFDQLKKTFLNLLSAVKKNIFLLHYESDVRLESTHLKGVQDSKIRVYLSGR